MRVSVPSNSSPDRRLARRKDWMTTLTGFTEVLGQDTSTAVGECKQRS